MTAVAKAPWSDDDMQSVQHDNETTRRNSTSDSEASTRSSTISDFGAISRLCHYFRSEHDLHTQNNQARHQMTTDLLGISTALDFHQGQPKRERLESSCSNEPLPDLKPQALRWRPKDFLLETSELPMSGRLPTERWLAEERKHAPFNTIEACFSLDFMSYGDFEDLTAVAWMSLQAKMATPGMVMDAKDLKTAENLE